MLLDTHYHVDFLPGDHRGSFSKCINDLDIAVVAQTLLPSDFQPGPLQSLGFHPWQIRSEQVAAELATFDQAVGNTRFIGEIGLDFSPRRLESAPRDLQEQVFTHIMSAVVDAAALAESPYICSIHAVRAASAVLDILQELDVVAHNVVPIIHWFSGNSEELTRLIRFGGYVSFNPMMLDTKRGRAYAKQVPADQLLLESDFPTDDAASSGPTALPADFGVRQAHDLRDALTGTLTALAGLRGVPVDELAAAITANQRRLYF